MRRTRRGLTILLIALLALWQGAAPVAAATSGPYSVAYEDSQGAGYIGVAVTRQNTNYSMSASGSGCSGAVYQTQWVFLNASATAWFEIGTADCPGTTMPDFYFDGWSSNDNFQWLTVRNNFPTNASHLFQIQRGYSSQDWYFKVDGVVQGPKVTWNSSGIYVSAGLESYVDSVLPAADWGSLQFSNYLVSSGAWTNWAGRDSQSYGPGPNMCGSWITDTTWRAGEFVSC